ncbi:hypothetical protein IQ270_29810, partial [Microcoleus sp. LEGE 07076]|uniref:hypothetical protein n=1 Tax=Microcoleus sp. LEGE 07076 TaxID=915322 RepID=UPI00187FD415
SEGGPNADLFPPCYLSTRARAEGLTEILLPIDRISSCLPRLFLAAAGLKETFGAFSTVTSIDGGYSTLTLADRAFLMALERGDFPVSGSVAELQSYFIRVLSEDEAIATVLREN